ncbi:MAG: hypothetical protein ACOQNY_00695 [Mycoplasmoidaceae bacterium]
MKKTKLLFSGGLFGLLALSSCGYQQNAAELLMKIFNSYTEEYQESFWDHVATEDTQRKIHTDEGLICKCTTDAVLLWAYGPGYENWNHYLHDGQESSLDDRVVSGSCDFPSTSDPYNKGQNTKWSLKLKDYKLLDQAFDWGDGSSTLGINVHAYHGFEPDESDMVNFINSTTPGLDISKMTKEQAIAKGFTPSKLIGNNYTDLGFLATAMDVTSSMHWIETRTDNYVVPFLEMDIDKNVKGAYISYSNKKFYDGFFLSWPWEYQLLCQRNLKITVTGARWCKSDTNKDLLWMNCSVTSA